MLKQYTVCLTFNREQCEADTAEIAKRNNAVDYVIEPVVARPSLNFAYRGSIIKEEERR